MPLNFDERNAVISKLRAKGASPICPVCGKNQWLLPDDYTMMGVLTPPTAVPIPTKVISTLSLICGNCGFMEVFASGIVNQTNLPPVEERHP
jgi:hypothetical protein